MSQPDKELDQQEEEDAKNGAILVHSLENGKPDLDHFMEQLEYAMDKVEDPVFMEKISKCYIDKRKSKQYQRPSFTLRQPQGSIPSIRGSIRGEKPCNRLSGFACPSREISSLARSHRLMSE